jgi:hypothetical protein
MARTPKNVQANPHVTSPAAVDPSADLATEASGQSAAALPDPVDAPLEGEEHKLAEDAADAAGIGSAHGGEPTDPASDAAPDVVDEVRTLDVQILSIAEPAGEVMDEIHTERLKLELRLDELGDPIARRRVLAQKIEDEIEDHKHEEKAHTKRLGALRYELKLEEERGQDQLEEIRLANIRLDQLKVLAEQKAAAIAEAARLAATAPARIAGDSV